MAFQLSFDHTNRIILLSVDGQLTDRVLLEGYAALRSCFEYYGACDCIVDYSRLADISITSQGVRYLAERPTIYPMDCVMINIAPQNVMYGMARMFQMLTSDSRPNFRVVHTFDEALVILGIESPTFTRIAPAPWQPTLDREQAA